MHERPTHLDLFSGIGGFALAARWAGFRTIGFCEIDGYCRKVLAKNFLADTSTSQCNGSTGKGLSGTRRASERFGSECSKIFGNIFDLDGRDFAGVDLITGGFPCQPFSIAGKRRGSADDRAIWPEMFRVIKEARPTFCLAENVPGIIPMELDNVLSDLEGIGYAVRAFVIPACAVDARHRRDRLWIICGNTSNTNSNGLSDTPQRQNKIFQPGGKDASGSRQRSGTVRNAARWLPEPDMGRVAHGIPSRVDQLKGLGNAIVPQVAYAILEEIRKLL